MKKVSKCLFLTANAVLVISVLAGCGGKKVGPEVDTTKTQLYVKYNNGGMGDVWLNKLDAEFIDLFKDHSFEAGKKGVQIIRDDAKRNISPTDVRGNKNMVYIQEKNNYSEYIAAGAMKDLTSLINDYAVTGVDAKESGRRIIDKIDQTFKDYLDWNGSYYAIPLFEANVGLTYNVELFESKNLFLREGANADNFTSSDFEDVDRLSDLFVDEDHTTRSIGPDNSVGTLDDGLPATYQDFRALIAMMKLSHVIPFIWNSTDPNYLTSLCNDIWATNEGKENFIMNLKMSGNATDLVKISENQVVRDGSGNVVTESLAINALNKGELSRQKGKLAALDFAQLLVGNENYYTESWNTSYTTALEYFINPSRHTKIRDIGMIVEGSWFLQEAAKANCFNGSEEKQFAAKFSPMVLPKATRAQVGETYVRTSDRKSLMFISNYIDGAALEVAKAYLSFLQSDHALETYTIYTHNPRAMDYNISNEAYNQMSFYGKCLWDISRNYNSTTIPMLPMSNEAKARENEIDYTNLGFATAATGGNPVKNFFDWNESKTADQYFVDIYNYKKA